MNLEYSIWFNLPPTRYLLGCHMALEMQYKSNKEPEWIEYYLAFVKFISDYNRTVQDGRIDEQDIIKKDES